MRIGFFCYSLSGFGPATRTKTLIDALADRTDHEPVVLTSKNARYDHENVEIHRCIDVRPRFVPKTLRKTRKVLGDVDIVHVPINIYQVLFVRTIYLGPLVIGPGIQHELPYRLFARVLKVDAVIETHEYVSALWEKSGIDATYVYPFVDTDLFRPYGENRLSSIRDDMGICSDQQVLLYVGELSKFKGAHIFDDIAQHLSDREEMAPVVVGDGPLRSKFENRSDLQYAGYVPNNDLPKYYNIADITIVPSEAESFSIVSLESIACGTPVVTTASEGCTMYRLFHPRGTYVWAPERSAESIVTTSLDLLRDPAKYQEQVKSGFRTIERMGLEISASVTKSVGVYESVLD